MSSPGRVDKYLNLIFYYFFCTLVSAFALHSYAKILEPLFVVQYQLPIQVCVVLGQVLFQWIMIWRSPWEDLFTYCFIALTISMLGSLCLLPFIAFNFYYSVHPSIALAFFSIVVFAMFLLHVFWVGRERLPGYLSITWILYRALLILPVVFPAI